MSRSWRKKPILKDGGCSSKEQKKRANRAVRNYKDELSNGSAYKKVYPQYDINDYILYWPEEKAIKDWYESQSDMIHHGWGVYSKFKTLNEFLKWYRKEMYRK